MILFEPRKLGSGLSKAQQMRCKRIVKVCFRCFAPLFPDICRGAMVI